MPIIRKQVEIEVYVQIEVQVARQSHLAFQNNTAPKNAMAYHPLNIASALKHFTVDKCKLYKLAFTTTPANQPQL